MSGKKLIIGGLAAALAACNPPSQPSAADTASKDAPAEAASGTVAAAPSPARPPAAPASVATPSSRDASAEASAVGPALEPAPPPASAPPAARSMKLPRVLVHKTETCGCCHLWVEHLRSAGFTVEVNNLTDVNPVKERLGVPYGKGSCHTAEVGGYFVEGHVPAQDIKRLLATRPDAKGLVLPGMPLGSPGMEVPDGRTQPYTVELVDSDGTTSAFARH